MTMTTTMTTIMTMTMEDIPDAPQYPDYCSDPKDLPEDSGYDDDDKTGKLRWGTMYANRKRRFLDP